MKNQRIIRWILVAFLGIAIFGFVDWLIFSGPQSRSIAELLEVNATVVSEYGTIKEIQVLGLPGSEKEWDGTGFSFKGTWSGTYYFKIIGEKKTGIAEVEWKQESGQPVRILSILTK